MSTMRKPVASAGIKSPTLRQSAVSRENVQRMVMPDDREAMMNAFAVHGQNIATIARRHGLKCWEAERIIFHEVVRRFQRQIEAAYQSGRRNPLPPLATQRRVA